ncbi:MAG: LytTR family transcriptional regulator [Chlorobi bacterium]|nr:LytTR family transcriptional regulator [Chlorobiota bacterium]
MDINKKIPRYLTEKGNLIRTIFLTAIFALIFINIYSPFDVRYKFNITGYELLFYSSLIIITGVLVVVISRMMMYYYYRQGKELSYLNYGLWIVAEITAMALFYTFYELFILHDKRPFPDLFTISVRNTALILILAYSVIWLYLSWKDKKYKLEALSSGILPTNNSNVMIPFKDERGILRLSIKKNDFLYCRGNDNYVTICYDNGTSVSKFLIRTTLKKLESALGDYSLVRTHRSYIINFDKVKLIEKDKDGMIIRMDTPYDIKIPVSATYLNDVLLKFGQL